jgi:hypothetical protein
MNGAWPASTPEFRCQVESGFFDRPAKYRVVILSVQLGSAFGVGEVAEFGTLQEAGGELAAEDGSAAIEVGVVVKAEFGEKERPSVPGAIGLRVGAFGFGVVDAVG